MFSILPITGLDEIQRGLAVVPGEGAGQRHSGDVVFLDRVDAEQVFGDIIEGSDDDHRVGFELGHRSHRSQRQQYQHEPTYDLVLVQAGFAASGLRGWREQPRQCFDEHGKPPWLLSL